MEEKNKEELKRKGTMHIAAFVLGIISVVTMFFCYITVPTGILAIIFGVKSSRKTGSKLGKTGMILGIVGLSLFALIYISIILNILMYNIL